MGWGGVGEGCGREGREGGGGVLPFGEGGSRGPVTARIESG